MIRVASYNIQKAIGLDLRRRPGRILDVIAELDADIVALQEVDRRFGDRRSALPADLITSRTGYRIVPIAERPHSIGWHGNAIVVRSSMQICGHERHVLPQLEPRGAISTIVDTGTGQLRLCAVHLSLLGAARRRQMRFLAGKLDLAGDGVPTVVLGDFNDWFWTERALAALPQTYKLMRPGRSFPAAFPLASLDRILVSPGLTVRAAGVHRSPKSRIASDHLPVWADLSFA